jgi:hypothetical protein
VRASDSRDTNSPDSLRSPSDSAPACTNSPDETSISSDTYDARGEFGEFWPAVPESLGKNLRRWSPPNRRSQRINPRWMCTRRWMWRATANWRCRWITSFESLSRRSRGCGSKRISCVAMIGSTAMSWASRRQRSTPCCSMWQSTPVSGVKPSEITIRLPSDGASPQCGQRHRQPQERHRMNRPSRTQTSDDVGHDLTKIVDHLICTRGFHWPISLAVIDQ